MSDQTGQGLQRAADGIVFEQTRLLKDGGYCLSAAHGDFLQPIRFTITPSGGPNKGWQITAWLLTQTCFENDTWSFPQVEATPLVDQPALERVLRRVAPRATEEPNVLAGWSIEISATLARVLRYVTLYDAVGCAHRHAA